jgi:hypothetical protein
MAVAFDVRFDTRGLRRELAGLQANLVEQTAVRALNRAIVTVRKQAGVEIRKEIPIPARSLTRRMKITRAKRGDLNAAVKLKDYDPALGIFSPKWRQRQPIGATVKLPGKARQRIPGAFVADTRYGRPGVFRREGRARTPIKFLRASDAGLPTLGKAALQVKADGVLNRLGAKRFREEFQRDIASRFAGRGGRG